MDVARTIRKPKRHELMWFWYLFDSDRDIKKD